MSFLQEALTRVIFSDVNQTGGLKKGRVVCS